MTSLRQPPVQPADGRRASRRAKASQDAPPARLGPYRLLRPLGKGGMAVVHLAADTDGRLVAVKTVRLPADGQATVARCRLDREVAAMSRVRSPFVAELTDADLTGEVPYIVTRFVHGRNLAQVVAAQGPLRGRALQRLAYGVAEALAAVHAAGVVHRDLKPGNVMMAGGDPIVIDFGIAYQSGDDPITLPGMYLGTPGYLAPEVIEGQRARAPADVHAWGATVGFAARGQHVYGTGSYETVFSRIVRSDATLDGIHGALYPLVAAALLRQPDQRPTAGWLARELGRLDLTVPAPSPTSLPPSPAGAGPAAGPAAGPETNRSAGQPRQEFACQRPQGAAGVLPAVRDTQVFHAAIASPDSSAPGRPGRHRLLALATLAMAVGASLIMPVAGTAAVAGLLTLLRTADRARRGHARRVARGSRARGLLLLAGSIPWALARSVIETALLAPFLLAAAGLAVAGLAAAGGAITHHGAHALSAWAAVAAAYTVVSCLGPRSRSARGELNRAFDVLASAPLTAVMSLLTLATLAATIVCVTLVKAPPLWPLAGLHTVHIHVPDLSSISRG